MPRLIDPNNTETAALSSHCQAVISAQAAQQNTITAVCRDGDGDGGSGEGTWRAQHEGRTLIWCAPCCSSGPLALRCWRGASVADEKEMESNIEG